MTAALSSPPVQAVQVAEPQPAPRIPETPQPGFACVYLTRSARDLERASALLAPEHIRIFHAAGLVQAVNRLRRTRSRVLLTDTVYEGGNWKEAFEVAGRFRRPPALVVAARLAGDRLWLAVLERGAFGVVHKPFEQEELSKTLIDAHAQASGGELHMTA